MVDKKLGWRRAQDARRWRKQDYHRVPTDLCPDCQKRVFSTLASAEEASEHLSKVLGKPQFVYEDHGQIHLTSHPKEL